MDTGTAHLIMHRVDVWGQLHLIEYIRVTTNYFKCLRGTLCIYHVLYIRITVTRWLLAVYD